MSSTNADVGDVLRRFRLERQLSLATVAAEAGVSVATLSRVETNKQSVDVALLVDLARILGVATSDLLDGQGDHTDTTFLARQLGALRASERTKVFLEASRRGKPKELHSTVDDLLLTIDVLRDELLLVRREVRRRSRR